MKPTPAKRARRTSSPPSPSASSSRPDTSSRPGPSLSPSHSVLPHPTPSQLPGPPFPLPSSLVSPVGGPSSWSSAWPPGGGPSSRRSMDARSPSSAGSPRMEGLDENQSTDTGMVFTRDVSTRAPRSMMACTRCRRQKMKCDGPNNVPCRGCRQSGQPCVFESRSRPKSISALPSRAPPFFAGRPPTPTGAPGFYPSGPQPAPPALSRPPTSNESYALRSAREPMPPPPTTSISALTSPYPPQSARAQSPPSSIPPPPPQQPSLVIPTYHPPPLQLPPFSSSGPPRLPSPANSESRLRHVESALRNLSSVPHTLNHLQNSIASLQRTIESMSSALAPSLSRSSVEVSDIVWEDYRSRAWPLTPWLVGLRESQGLSGLVVDLLGKRAVVDRSEGGRVAVEEASKAIKAEVSRLISSTAEWSREEVRAAGVYAVWTNDTALASLAVSHGRNMGLDRIWTPRKTLDDWREWIYLTIMDHLSQLVDFVSPLTSVPLAGAWRDRLGVPSSAHGDPAVRDRDHKLLAWLEYAETLAEIHQSQQRLLRSTFKDDIVPASEMVDIWRRYASRWEAWAGIWSAKSDPILSLHFNYALLSTTSPLFLARDAIWVDLSRENEGRVLLERARDAAFAVIQAICSPEIGRTLVYSFTLYRPVLAQALLLLIHLTILPPISPPLVSAIHVQDVVRSTYDTILSARPLDWSPGSLLADIVERGDIAMRPLIGAEPGRELWKRLLG